MKKLLSLLIATSLTIASTASFADNQAITKSLALLGFQKQDFQINPTSLENINSIVTPKGIFYITNDGKYLIEGPIYDLQGQRPTNIANSTHLAMIKTIAQDAIVYQAPKEKHVIYVFTDYTCHYCKLLHENIQQYLDAGISVHYFAFPRQGADSMVAKDMQAIWNSKNRKAAFDSAYANGVIPNNVPTKVTSVKTQFNVGEQLGITGTPTIVLSNGHVLSGYIPAENLIQLLK